MARQWDAREVKANQPELSKRRTMDCERIVMHTEFACCDHDAFSPPSLSLASSAVQTQAAFPDMLLPRT